MPVSRRDLLKFAATAVPAVTGLGALAEAFAPARGSADSPGIPQEEGGPQRLTTFNVRHYGAVGDGVADDTAAIHAARDAAGVGGAVVFPPGAYLTTGVSATIVSQVWQIMAGATIKSKGSGSTAGPITVDAPNVTITGGGAVDGNRSVIGGNAHVWSCITGTVNASDLTVDNITVQNAVFYGVWGQASRTRVTRCRFSRIYATPIMLSSYYLAVLLGSTMQDTYDMEASDNFIDRRDEDPATLASTAISIRGNNDTSGALHTTYRGKALRNTILMPVNPAEPTGIVCGIEFGAQSYYGLAEGNKIENGSMGISFARGHYGKAIGNTLVGQTFYAIEMADSPGCVIQGNIINGSGRLGSLPSGAAIAAHGAAGLSTDISIVGNRIYGIHDSGRSISLSHSRYAVNGNAVDSKCGMTLSNVSDANVSNNVVSGNGTGQGFQLVNCNRIVILRNTVQSQNVGVQISAPSGTVGIFNISNNRFWECSVPVDEVTVSGNATSQIIIKGGNVVGPP
jgi:hypothetical protein